MSGSRHKEKDGSVDVFVPSRQREPSQNCPCFQEGITHVRTHGCTLARQERHLFFEFPCQDRKTPPSRKHQGVYMLLNVFVSDSKAPNIGDLKVRHTYRRHI